MHGRGSERELGPILSLWMSVTSETWSIGFKYSLNCVSAIFVLNWDVLLICAGCLGNTERTWQHAARVRQRFEDQRWPLWKKKLLISAWDQNQIYSVLKQINSGPFRWYCQGHSIDSSCTSHKAMTTPCSPIQMHLQSSFEADVSLRHSLSHK